MEIDVESIKRCFDMSWLNYFVCLQRKFGEECTMISLCKQLKYCAAVYQIYVPHTLLIVDLIRIAGRLCRMHISED